MKIVKQVKNRRLPLYIAISVLLSILAIIVVCGVVAFSGSQMLGFAKLTDDINHQVHAVRETARDASRFGMLFFSLLWFISPASASALAIIGSRKVLDFQEPRWRKRFRIFTLALVLVAIWQLVPWIVSYTSVDREVIPSRVVTFRWIHIVINTIVGLFLTFTGKSS